MSKIEAIPIIGSYLCLPISDSNYQKVLEKYGKTHAIEAVIGTSPKLSSLKNGQSVCYGDGELYHFRLTEK